LLQHPGVQQTVVVAGEDPHDSHAIRLIAYVVPAAAQSGSPAARHAALGDRLATDLRAYLKERLPDFMVPSVFIGLDQIPLTTNGKIDRKRLPVPPRDSFTADSALYAAPGNGVEEQLAAIFGEVLGLDRVGAHSDFFELGGDSLLAVQTLSRVKAAFATSISIRSFFSAPTVAQLAHQIEAQRGSTGVSSRLSRPAPEIRRNPRIPLSRASRTGSE